MPLPKGFTRDDTGGTGGEQWWKKKEPKKEPAPLQPMPVPVMPGPQAPGQPQLPRQAPPQTRLLGEEPGQTYAPWTPVPGAQRIPWALYQHGPEPQRRPEPEPEPEPTYPTAPAAKPASTPSLIGLMSERVAPQIIAREGRPAPASEEIARYAMHLAGGPDAMMRELEREPEYIQSLSDIYLEVAREMPGAGMRRHTVEAQRRYQAQFFEPIDPTASLEELRAQWSEGRAKAVEEDFMGRRALAHQQKAQLAIEEGDYGRAVRQTYLAESARGMMGFGPGIGYLGELASRPQRALEQAAGRYWMQPRSWLGIEPTTREPYGTATPEELAQASTLLHEEQARIEREVPLSHRAAMAVGTLIRPQRMERRWNPAGLPVVRKPSDVRPYLVARFGDTPRVQLAAAWAESMSFSGTERMLSAAERIVAGEDPLSVIIGHEVNLDNPTERDYEVVMAYRQAAAAQGKEQEAIQTLRETGYIPGEAQAIRELAGAVFADPIDWVPVGTLLGIATRPAQRVVRSMRYWTTKGDDALDVAKVSDDLARAAARVTNAGDTAADARQNSKVADFLRMLNPFARTPEGQATRIREPAMMVSTMLVSDMRPRNADQAKALIRLLAENPAQLEPRLGPMARSQPLGDLKPLFEAVAAQLDDQAVFPSLHRQYLSLGKFTDELAKALTTTADDLMGVTETVEVGGKLVRRRKKGSTLTQLADMHRAAMRDSALTLNFPPYMIRNTGGDVMTMAHDGIATLDTYEHERDFISRLGAQTGRTRGLLEAGPVAGERGGLAELPVVGPAVRALRRTITTGQAPVPEEIVKKLPDFAQNLVKKPTIFGEEVRYTKAFGAFWRKADTQWQKAWQYPDEIVDLLGDINARRLKGVMAQTVNGTERDLAMGEFLAGNMRRFGVDAWLPEGSELSSAMKVELNQRLGDALGLGDEAASRAKMHEVVNDARQEIMRHADQTIAESVVPPTRKSFTTLENEQDVRESVVAASKMAEAMGVPPAQAVADAEALQTAIQDAQLAAIDAEVGAMRKANEAGLSQAASRAVTMDVRTSIEDARQTTRATVDRWRYEAWEAYTDNPANGTTIWDKVKYDTANAWDAFRTKANDAMGWMDGAIGRLANGEPLQDVLPGYRTTLAEATQRYAERYRILADQDEILQVTEAGVIPEFERQLQFHRLAVDTSSDWAWRMAVENPSVDATDILYSAQRDIDEMSRVARAKHDQAIVAMRVGQIDYETYVNQANEAWAPYWDQAPHRMMLAASEIADAEDLAGVFSPKAFQDVAKAANVEIGDLAAIGQDGWQRMRDEAQKLVDAATKEIARKGNMRDVRFSGQLDTMMWPVDVEDIAHWLGYDNVTEMAPDDWRHVAQVARTQQQKYQFVATEVGRQAEVARVSGRKAELGVGALAEEVVTAGALSRKGERKLLQQLTQQARVDERRMVEWLLAQAGYTEGDFRALSKTPQARLQQELRLLAELGQESLAQTQGGAVSQVGTLASGRRQAVIDAMPAQVRQLVKEYFPGVADDPLEAVAFQWERLAERAEDWAGMIENGVPVSEDVPQRFYTSNGWPILRYDRAEIEGLLNQSTPIAQRREEYEKVLRFARQRQEAWSRADWDEATRYASTDWLAASSEQVVIADRATEMAGNAAPPRAADLALSAEKAQLGALDTLEESLERDWSDVLETQAGKYTKEQLDQIRAWYREQFVPEYNARILSVTEAAREGANFALLDYSDRRRLDTWLATFVPYHFWYTRSARNWATRFAANPSLMGDYYRYKFWRRQANEQRRGPSRMEGMVEVPVEQLPEWTGQRAYIDPLRYVWPFESLLNPYDFENPLESKNAVDGAYRMARALGMRPFPLIEIPLIVNGVIERDPRELYNLLPQTAPIQAVTALGRQYGAEWIPPGGIYIEAWLRRVLGLPEAEPAQPYRVERQQVGMELDRIAQGDPSMLNHTLRAMELMHNVASTRIRLIEALGVQPGTFAQKQPGTYVSERVKRLAAENGWSDDDLRAAQELLAQAVQRAALERAATVLTGQAGMPAYLYTTGEQRARELATRDVGARYSPVLDTGSRAEWQAFREAQPEAWLRPRTFEILPGETQAEFGPQEVMNLLTYNAESEEIEQQYQTQIEEQIRNEPWNTQAVGALRQERGQALADLRERLRTTGEEYDETALWSVFGATPEERTKRRREQVLSIIAYNEPNLQEFIDPDTGEPDYDAWEEAKDMYYELGIKAVLEADPAIQAILLEQPIEEAVLERLPITEEARQELEQRGVHYTLGKGEGGGWWQRTSGEIHLFGQQWEAAIHETAHSWWEEQRKDLATQRAFVQAVLAYAEEGREGWSEYPEVAALARAYVYGDATGFSGLRLDQWGVQDDPYYSTDWNDQEMFAGLASGVMGSHGKLPPELRKFYTGFLSGEEIDTERPLGVEWDIVDRLEEVVGRITTKDIEAYRRRNDTALEAAQRTWGELYGMAWEAYSKAVEAGENKGMAYRTYIEGLPAMQGQALIQAIQQEYPDRWSDEELRQALVGVQFPSGDETHVLRMPQAQQELTQARDEFYQWFRWHVPPGDFEYAMRDAIPLLNAIRDFGTREALDESGFTAEQYREALKMVQEYVRKELPPEEIAGEMAQEYTFARGMNNIFARFRESKFPGMAELLAFRQDKWGDRYVTKAERDERDAFDAQHPELQVYREWEKAFAQEHPVWAKYYRPWLVGKEGEEAAAGAEGEAGAGGEGRIRAAGGGYAGYYYAGGGYSPISSWSDFAGMVDVDTLTSLFRFWGQGTSLSGTARRALETLYGKYGWGEFDDWLAWLQRLYQRAFASQARAVPGVRYPHWIPGVWRT